MQIMTVGLLDSIRWAVRKSDPATVPLCYPHGWSIVIPLVPLREPFREPASTQLYFQNGEQLYLTAYSLHFVTPEGASGEEVNKVTPSILKRLRYTSKQPQLPAHHAVLAPSDIDALPAAVFPPATREAAIVRDSFLDVPVTMDAVREAGELPLDFNPPLYDTLLLDAIKLLQQDDYRGAIQGDCTLNYVPSMISSK